MDVNVSTSNIHLAGRKQLSEDLATLTTEKTALEEQIKRARIVKDVPQQAYLEYLTGYHQLLVQLTSLLVQQYEMAKMDEAKEDITFQVIDRARVPFRRHKPKRTLIVIVSFIASFIIAVVTVFFLEYIEKMKQLTASRNAISE